MWQMKKSIKRLIGDNTWRKISLVKAQVNMSLRRRLPAYNAVISKQEISMQEVQQFGLPGVHTFFGYYDISPFNAESSKLLAMATAARNHLACEQKPVQIGYFDLINKNQGFTTLNSSPAWCWQMGCRLQWLPANDNEHIIFNTMVKGAYGAIVQHIHTQKIERQYDYPVYAIDSKGERALLLNFSRLHRLRPGYGYRNLPDQTAGEKSPAADGIWLMDLAAGDRELLINLENLAHLEPQPSMQNAEHYVNHLAFNPSGNRFMFLHLWAKDGRRFNRLLTSNLDGDDVHVLENWAMVSHYAWKSDSELLATVNSKNGTQYILYQDGACSKQVIAPDFLNQDGHPSYSADKNFLLTDTYPDKYGDQQLLLYTTKGDFFYLTRFFHPPQFRGQVRCDLHPRWDSSGKIVCVDSCQSGCRSLYVISLDKARFLNAIVGD
jgi:hypothetical protein